MDNKENTDTKTRQYNNFDKSAWKTNDKAWMKERRAGWASVKTTLDHINETSLNAFTGKKSFKYIKQFYLTGCIDFPEDIGGISYLNVILEMNSPLDQIADCSLLLECWLTPEPSTNKWKRIVERYENSIAIRNVHESIKKPFEMNREIYQQALLKWYTTSDQISLFSGLEDELNEFFKPFSDISQPEFFWGRYGGILNYFLEACGSNGGYNDDGKPVYNHRHPVYDCSEQIIDTLVPYYNDSRKNIVNRREKDLEEFIGSFGDYSPEQILNLFDYNYKPEEQTFEELFDELKLYNGKKKQKYLIKSITRVFIFLFFISIHSKKHYSEQTSFASRVLMGIEQLDLPDELRKALEKGKKQSTNQKKIKKLMKYD